MAYGMEDRGQYTGSPAGPRRRPRPRMSGRPGMTRGRGAGRGRPGQGMRFPGRGMYGSGSGYGPPGRFSGMPMSETGDTMFGRDMSRGNLVPSGLVGRGGAPWGGFFRPQTPGGAGMQGKDTLFDLLNLRGGIS